MSKGKVKIWLSARELIGIGTGTIFFLNTMYAGRTLTYEIFAPFDSDLHNLLDGMLRDKLYYLDITEIDEMYKNLERVGLK